MLNPRITRYPHSLLVTPHERHDLSNATRQLEVRGGCWATQKYSDTEAQFSASFRAKVRLG